MLLRRSRPRQRPLLSMALCSFLTNSRILTRTPIDANNHHRRTVGQTEDDCKHQQCKARPDRRADDALHCASVAVRDWRQCRVVGSELVKREYQFTKTTLSM